MRIATTRFELSAPAWSHLWKEAFMKTSAKAPSDDLRTQYKASDFPGLVRGKYTGRLRERSNVIILDPELIDLFPNSEAVNSALRSLSEIARRARLRQPG
jgi:hypothetical protein